LKISPNVQIVEISCAAAGTSDKNKIAGGDIRLFSVSVKEEDVRAICPPASRGPAEERFLAGVRDLCRRAAQKGITLYLQTHPHKWYSRTKERIEFIEKVNAENLRFALNTGHIAMAGEKTAECVAAAGNLLGLVLLSASKVDSFGQKYDAHLPIHTAEVDLAPIKKVKVIKVLDADYPTWDDAYRDICRISG
jgi:sugar phosphate isomerase/epimerase